MSTPDRRARLDHDLSAREELFAAPTRGGRVAGHGEKDEIR
jgi:hypothetical protein